jgi:Bacterial Ig-like domain (group 3)
VETHDQGGRTTANVAVTVTGEDRLPAAGAVSISDNGRTLAGVALNKQGQAAITLDLPGGDHSLTASYQGDTSHRASISDAARTEASGTGVPDFQISVAPATLSLTAGGAGTVTASITPVNASALTAPMFVTLSCSGVPDQSSCVFTPENIEILPNATAAVTSSMVILTQKQEGLLSRPQPGQPGSDGVALAILLPGALGLGGLAFAVRRNSLLARLSLLALVALVAALGTTACNARYDYFNHGPPPNPATPSGTYTIDVSAQSSDGVSATTHTTTLALTVK